MKKLGDPSPSVESPLEDMTGGLMHDKQTAGVGVTGQYSAPRNVRLLGGRRRSRGELDRLRFEALWKMAVKNVGAKNGPQRDRAKPPKARIPQGK